MLIFGSHVPISLGGIISGLQFIQVTNMCSEIRTSKKSVQQVMFSDLTIKVAGQIFLKNPMKVTESKIDENQIKKTKLYIEKFNIFLVVHGQYIINFIRPSKEINWAIKSVIDDIRLLEKICVNSGVVIHLGKKQTQTNLECITNFGENIQKVIEKTKDCKTKIILETSTKTKKGSDIFHDIIVFGQLKSHLVSILGKTLFKQRIGFCIDTCHIFSSGYDIRTKKTFDQFMNLWDQHIGNDNITLFHLNDLDKKAIKNHSTFCGLGCCKDLHEELGKGLIYEQGEGLKSLLDFANIRNIPIISETGGDSRTEFELIKILL
jgi:deoxyribonuclease-4